MTHQITIQAGPVETTAELNSTRVAQAIWEALPVEAEATLWGEEIYFSIPVQAELEAGQTAVNAGDLGYWPEGPAFCIFFGPTPISRVNEIRPASAVTVFGRISGDLQAFKQVKDGDVIKVSRVEAGRL